MGNNLHKIEKDLRSIAKRYKSVKYSVGLAILFLMLGVSAFSEEVNTEQSVAQVATREELKTSVGSVQAKLNNLRNDNKKEIEDSKLELIQLMEQGDQVVKSPWASWQFGANYFHEKSKGEYKGRGDKSKKYIYNAEYLRGDWKERNAMDALESQKVSGVPLTPGNDSLATWKNVGSTSSGGVKIEKNTAINSSTNGSRSWGLVDLLKIKEPTNEVEILARISPKEVNKKAVPLNIKEPKVEGIKAPIVKPNVNTPLKPPKIVLPEIKKVKIEALSITPPSAPGVIAVPNIGITIATPGKPVPPTVSVSVNEPSAPGAPTINIPVTPPKIVALNIETPPTVSVTPPTVSAIKPVAFSVDPTIDSNKYKIQANSNNSTSKDSDGKFINNMNNALNNLPDLLKVEKNTSSNRNYVTINGWNYNTNVDPNGTVTNPVVLPSTKRIDITVDNNRALVIDQTLENFEFHSKGTINLYGSQNMGIDLQGTHRGSGTSPAITTIINDGKIIGYASNKYDDDKANKEQVGFGFSNIDASRNTTMTHMVNNKEITLNAPSSAGMQLKAEDPNNWQPNWGSYPIVSQSTARDPKADRGKVLMKADNRKVINLNGSGSFGIITIFNPGLNKNFITWNGYNEKNHNLRAQREFSGIKILPGGEIGRSALADSKYTSGVYNTGTINIKGDESVGVGILHEIQEVKIGGTVNIGTEAVTQETKISNSEDTKTKTYDIHKVEGAVGVFAGVPTLPVKVGEVDTMGNKNNTGATVGTETTEVSGAINIGRNARESIGLLVGDSVEALNKGVLNGFSGKDRELKRSGSITLKAGPNILGNSLGDGEINIDGDKNYGFVVNSDSNKSVFSSTTTDDLQQSIDKLNYGIGINEGKINVKGINSIGFALLKGGNSKNTGEITVKESDMTSWHPLTGIVNSQPQYDLTQNSVGFYGEQDKFTNEGKISVNTPNRVGNKAILLKGNATGITFDNKGDISVNGKNNIGVYAEGTYTFNHEKNGNNKIAVGSDAIGIYAKGNTGNVNIKAPIELEDSNGGTTIGIYSDGNANVKFEDDSKLIVGKKAVGLFSQITANFKNTFQFNNSAKALEVSLDENSAFAFFNDSGATDIAEVLNKNIKFTTMKKGATFGYAKGGSTVTLDQDFDTTNIAKVVIAPESGTSVLVASNGSTVQVNKAKTLTTNTNIGLVATNGSSTNKSKAINIGTIISKINGGVGLYANSNSEATNETTGKITMKNEGSAAILGENNSDLKNKNLIELKEQESAGIYAKDSNATNTVTAGPPLVKAKIGLEKTKSAGMYAVLTNLANGDKKILNEANGTDKATIEIGANATSSAGMYGKVESTVTKVLTLENAGDIQVGSTSSVGIYAENEANDKAQLVAENKGLIKVTKDSSVGIYSNKKSTVKNSGTAANGIALLAKKTAGIIGNNGTEVTNTGDITLNSGTQPSSPAEGLVGISLDNTSTATNDGTITVNNYHSTGISGKGGLITNNKEIILNKENSVGVASTDGSVVNGSATGNNIEVKESSSVGIFAKATENIKLDKSSTPAKKIQNIENKGTITLNGGNAKTSSVGIYSLIDKTAITSKDKFEQNIKNIGTISVGTKSSAGIYIKDDVNRPNGNEKIISKVSNTGTINVTEESSAGIIGEYSEITNRNSKTKDGVIELSAKKTAGIIANKKSKVMNYGTIKTTAFSVGIGDGLVGISADNSTVINKNKENPTGMIGTILLNTAYSTGIYGKNESTLVNEGKITAKEKDSIGMAGENSLLTNKNIILLEEENSVGMFGTTNDTDPKNTTVINQRDDDNNLTGTITTKKKNSVGIFVSTVKAPGVTSLAEASAINRGTILIEEKSSAGMYGDEANIENTGNSTALVASITTKKDGSAAMYAKNSNATNKKKITVEGKDSAGILVELTKDKEIVGTNDIADNSTDTTNGLIEVKNEKSVGMLGTVAASVTTATSKLALFNKKAINVDKESAVGMMLENNSTNVVKANVTAENTGVITLKDSTPNKENIGILAKKNSTAINKDNGIINVNSVKSIGMLAKEGSKIENNSNLPPNPLVSGKEYGINLKAEDGVGMLAEGQISKNEVSTAINNAKIAITETGKKSIGMYAKDSGDVKNNKEIEVLAENGVGIFVFKTGTGENTSPNGKILLKNKETVGIFAKNNGNTHSAQNSGKISLENPDKTKDYTSLIGMFAQAENGEKASVKNTGTINVNTKKSVGIYAKNDDKNTVGDVDLHNAGTIEINNAGSAGIYAPNATVSKVGTINLKNAKDSDGSSAVYVSKGGKVEDTSSGIINLGTVNQNRVAYYVNGADSILRSKNKNDEIGKISGYGVGVYLEGDSKVGTAKIDKNTPKLHFTNAGLSTTGNGIIGLFLSGNTEIKDYTKGIVVGDTVQANPSIANDEKKYAIGIYADKQGTIGTPYEINTNITTGKEGVGIYSDGNSIIDYKGDITVGNGATAGIGIYITKSTGGNAGRVRLLGSKTDTSITLKGTGGVAVIASEGTTIDAGNATVELVGKDVTGVGVYAKKGSTAITTGWTFKNNGNQAEEVRSEEGKVPIAAGLKLLNPRMVLSHVINGETYVAAGGTVRSQSDGSHTAKENIGLMAEGVKNPTPPAPLTSWDEADFEAVNNGTIDFTIADKSTAIYVNSARAKNNGTINVGKNSTAIYGFYDKDTRKYEGAVGNPNKLEIKTTAASNISLGDQSTGMYLINAETVTNDKGSQITSTSGATKNVGIYAINGAVDKETTKETKAYSVPANYKILNMTTATKITLGNGAVGLYSKGKGTANADRNTVVNTGDITVGDKIVENKGTTNEKNYPAVAMYAENTNLTTTSAVRVGNDGIAFYGKNSNITADGTVNFSNKGVLAYLEKSNFISKLGNLGATQNTMLYLKDSTAKLDGGGNKVDIDVADGYTGAYISGNSQLTGVQKIKLGKDSTGIYLENTSPNFVSTAVSIEGTKDGARGIVAKDANFTNTSKISLSGKESVGIYSNANSTKKVTNIGELTLSGKKTLGVFLRGGQAFENKANINIADSANSQEPTIGIYTAEGTSNIKHTSGTIEVGEKSIGIYSKTPSNVEMNGGKIHVKDQAIGIYKEDGQLTVKGELAIDKHVATAKDTEPTGVYAVNGAKVVDQASKITVGEKSYGFILNNTSPTKTNVYTNTNAGSVNLGNDSVFLYSNGKANITNNRNLNSNNSDHLIGFYVKNGGELLNNGTINFSTGKGNIGIYTPAGTATNKGKILVGPTDDIDPTTGKPYSDPKKIVYGIGMAADNGGHIINETGGEIRVSDNKSIGMYGAGVGTVVENKGKILLDGSKATATNKIGSLTGVYVDEGATFRNSGIIKTTDSYAGRNGKINDNVTGLVGVAVMNGSTLINEATGKIYIDADNSTGVIIRGKTDANGNLIRRAVIKNYGEIRVRGTGGTAISWKDLTPADIAELERQINANLISTDPKGHELGQASGTDKDYQGVKITVKNGKATFTRNGVAVPDSEVEKINKLIGNQPNLGMSDIGFYVDTLGRTKPVTFDGVTPPVNSQLIIGTEFSEKTNKKEWVVSGNVIKPFLDQIQGRNYKITAMAGSLTWVATPVLDNYGQIVGIAMSKIDYKRTVNPEDNVYNFTDGLEQRYDKNPLGSAEKRLFTKLDGIGKNEDAVLTQAYDEMMGHQYANTQQRIQATGKILDKEFSYLRNSWSNPSKDSNKVKTFGMSGEYKTDTAGIIDYKNNAYGVAYVHEDETVRLGESTGWYAGIVHNKFKFKDIGNSKEEQLQGKVGIFKSIPFDYNNSLNWTISGDIFAGYNKMHRKFLVVDEVFNAKSKYNTYGVGVKNEVGKEFRLSEGLSVRPYGALRVEYGRMSKIKEKSGEMKLEVKSNDYLSIKPEVGTELAYKLHLGNKTLRAALAVAYENELGRVANGKNKARVAGTSADYFNIRGEKEDRRGNVKTDLNIGVDNQRVGVTGNVGYDTKAKNIRGGLGLRVIF